MAKPTAQQEIIAGGLAPVPGLQGAPGTPGQDGPQGTQVPEVPQGPEGVSRSNWVAGGSSSGVSGKWAVGKQWYRILRKKRRSDSESLKQKATGRYGDGCEHD